MVNRGGSGDLMGNRGGSGELMGNRGGSGESCSPRRPAIAEHARGSATKSGRAATSTAGAATITAGLRAAGCVFAEEEAALLIAEADSAHALESMVQERAGGIPLEYVLGWAEFCGIRMSVEAGVFVPRHRTEFLVDQAAAIARPGDVLLDLCCGVGAIGAAIAARIPQIDVYAAELDPVAARCARRNLGAGAQVFEGDLFGPLPVTLRGRVDLLVVNAPYVPTASIGFMPPEAREHEALATLDGGDDGLDVHRRIAESAGEWLAASGSLLIETSERQADETAAILTRGGLVTRIAESDDHDATIVIGRRLR